MKNLNKLHLKTVEFNARCGNSATFNISSFEFWKRLKDQIVRLKEEVGELEDAVLAEDLEGILDGTIDVAVVNSGVINLIEGADFDVDQAVNLVTENNALKYTKSYNDVQKWKEYHESLGTGCYIQDTIIRSEIYYCVRRIGDNKILKPKNFPSVDLSGCLPK